MIEKNSLFGEISKPDNKIVLPIYNDSCLQDIRDDVGDCTRCKLGTFRKQNNGQIVFGSGPENAKIVFIGEGPGADEDSSGIPFYGKSGKKLIQLIKAHIGLNREQVRLVNVVSCRPKDNRTPEKDEIAACAGFMIRQINIIKPKIVVPLGATAYNALMGEKVAITSVRGQIKSWNNFTVIPSYHPSFVLRSPDMERFLVADLQKIKSILEI